MSKLVFKLRQQINFKGHTIPYDEEYFSEFCQFDHQVIRKDSGFWLIAKEFFWPLVAARDYLFIDGFIEQGIGRLIKDHINPKTVFLEIGCGNMNMRRFLPKGICYNAMDVSFAQYHLERVLHHPKMVNLAAGSVTNIPLDKDSVSMVVAMEVLQLIPDINRALNEIKRVLSPNGILLVSLPNAFCYKYQKKGRPQNLYFRKSFQEAKDCFISQGFKYLKGYMQGFWLPLPLTLVKNSYQLPFSVKNEVYNTNFLFAFQKD